MSPVEGLARHARLVLAVITAVLAILVVAGTVTFFHPRPSRPASAPSASGLSYPRIQQAAGIIDLMRDIDIKQRPAVLRALNGLTLRVGIVDQAPEENAALRRAPRAEEKLQEFAAPGLDPGLRVFIDAAYPARETDTEGWPARIVWPTPDGRILLMTFIEQTRPVTGLPRIPSDVMIGSAGVAVAILALLLARRETQVLRHVTRAAEAFDGSLPPAMVDAAGGPEMRRLAVAVQEMQERVTTLLQERSFLIGAISHDLKTYLTRMRLRTEGLRDLDQREPMAGDIEDMTDLIDTSLAFARGTTMSQQKSLVDLADLIAIEAAERIALGRDVSAKNVDQDALVLGDPLALRRVLTNLVDNAIKFGRGRTEISLDFDEEVYRLVVDDDGPGVGEMERVAIFSPFYRIENSRNRRTGGSGLGLAIARQIVEAYGGEITVGTSPLGGARFLVGLPKARPRRD